MTIDQSWLVGFNQQQSWNLNESSITDDDLPAICNFAKQKGITELKLRANDITAKNINLLAALPSLKSLDLSHNKISDAGVEVFQHVTTLNQLSVAGCDITKEGAAFLSETGLIELDLSYNPIGDDGARAIALNKTIRYLKLDATSIQFLGTDALAKNQCLEELSLIGNGIGDAGIKALSQNQSLRFLDVTACGLSSRAVLYLSSMSTLLGLIIDRNCLGELGAIDLALNPTLKSLKASGCAINETGARKFLDNKSLVDLCLDSNEISDKTLMDLDLRVIKNIEYARRHAVMDVVKLGRTFGTIYRTSTQIPKEIWSEIASHLTQEQLFAFKSHEEQKKYMLSFFPKPKARPFNESQDNPSLCTRMPVSFSLKP